MGLLGVNYFDHIRDLTAHPAETADLTIDRVENCPPPRNLYLPDVMCVCAHLCRVPCVVCRVGVICVSVPCVCARACVMCACLSCVSRVCSVMCDACGMHVPGSFYCVKPRPKIIIINSLGSNPICVVSVFVVCRVSFVVSFV